MAPGQQDLLDDLPAMPVYRIETHIDPADLSLTGRMEVTLPAVEADALPEDLFFRLYPNLAHYAGSMSVDLVSVNDHGAPFSYEAANTAVHVVVPPDSVVAGKPIRVVVLDTQVYSNTGGQACTSGFTGQVSDMP